MVYSMFLGFHHYIADVYYTLYTRGRQPMARGPNVALFKKIMALLNPKKRSPKKFGKIGKKVRVDGPQQKKVPNFPIFWPTYHKRLATPAIHYTLYRIQYTLYSLAGVANLLW